MNVELESYNRITSDLDLSIVDLKLKLKAAEKEADMQRHMVNSGVSFVKRFKLDISELMKSSHEPKLLKTYLKKLYHKYCKESNSTDSKGGIEMNEIDLQAEYARQRGYLERTINSLQQQVEKDQIAHRNDNLQTVIENVVLIKEINSIQMNVVQGKIKALGEMNSLPVLPGIPSNDGSVVE